MSNEFNNFNSGRPPRIVTTTSKQQSKKPSSPQKLFFRSNSKSSDSENSPSMCLDKVKEYQRSKVLTKTIDEDLDDLEEYGMVLTPKRKGINTSKKITDIRRSSSLHVYIGDDQLISPTEHHSDALKFRKESKSTPLITNNLPFTLHLSPVANLSNEGRYFTSKEIHKIVIIQSLVRKWLVNYTFRKEEENRVISRIAFESNIIDEYNKEVERLTKLINEGKNCEELEQAKYLIEEYANSSYPDYDARLKYLFNLCDEFQNGSLCKNEFLLLINQLLGMSESFSSYAIFFPNEESRIDYITFYTWFISKENIHIYSKFRKRVSSLFSKQVLYPYVTHIKCVLHIEMVVNKLNEYDTLNPPRFCCSNCGFISYSPLILSQHVNQCKLDKKMEDNHFY